MGCLRAEGRLLLILCVLFLCGINCDLIIQAKPFDWTKGAKGYPNRPSFLRVPTWRIELAGEKRKTPLIVKCFSFHYIDIECAQVNSHPKKADLLNFIAKLPGSERPEGPPPIRVLFLKNISFYHFFFRAIAYY